jgi:hypothetical protein
MPATARTRPSRLAIGWMCAAAAVAAACGSSAAQVSPPTTFEDGVEHVPGPGYAHVEGDPIVAERAIEVKWVVDGQPSQLAVRFAPGERVVFDQAGVPDDQNRLSVDGVTCGGTFPTSTDVETDVRLASGPGACTVTIARTHPRGSASHEPGREPVVAP